MNWIIGYIFMCVCVLLGFCSLLDWLHVIRVLAFPGTHFHEIEHVVMGPRLRCSLLSRSLRASTGN